jgi:hypothetical protein
MIGIDKSAIRRIASAPSKRSARLTQNRKRSPTVGSIVLRLRKPFAIPLLTCENMNPA